MDELTKKLYELYLLNENDFFLRENDVANLIANRFIIRKYCRDLNHIIKHRKNAEKCFGKFSEITKEYFKFGELWSAEISIKLYKSVGDDGDIDEISINNDKLEIILKSDGSWYIPL